MRILLFGRTLQESDDWTRHYMLKYGMTKVVHVNDGDDRTVRGYEYFLAVVLPGFAERKDAEVMEQLILSRPGVLVVHPQFVPGAAL